MSDLSVCRSAVLKDTFMDNRSEVKDRDRTTCNENTIEKRPLVGNIVMVGTDVKFLSCMETCDPDFPGCSAWCRRESLMWSFSPQRLCWVGVEVGIDCFPCLFGNRTPILISSVFNNS